MQGIPQPIASDGSNLWQPDQELNPSCQVCLGRIILHDDNHHAIGLFWPPR